MAIRRKEAKSRKRKIPREDKESKAESGRKSNKDEEKQTTKEK